MLLTFVPDPPRWSVGDPHADCGKRALSLPFVPVRQLMVCHLAAVSMSSAGFDRTLGMYRLRGRPRLATGQIIRKASAHGLGHLRAPYPESDAPKSIPAPCMPLDKIGVERWQYDLWYQIIVAALDGHPDQVNLDYHPALNLPAASRYGATTPKLLRWFKTYNQNRLYRDQVKPFNFLLAFQASPVLSVANESYEFNAPPKRGPRPKILLMPRPIAPYNTDIKRAAQNCFDRETGRPMSSKMLKTYREALAQFHLSPESKFLNGDYLDRGPTIRRHVEATAVHHIGKEANRWEEQFYLGFDEEEPIEYGVARRSRKKCSKHCGEKSRKLVNAGLLERVAFRDGQYPVLWKAKAYENILLKRLFGRYAYITLEILGLSADLIWPIQAFL